MAGILVTGQPRSGKSRWLKEKGIPDLRRRGVRVCVLDPVLGGLAPAVAQGAWGADWVTNDVERFMAAFKVSHHCVWVVDEMGRWGADYKARVMIEDIAVTGGNRGNLGIFVAQRLMMIHPNIRNMCDTAVLFRQQMADLQDLAGLLNEPRILDAANLDRGWYMVVEPFKPPVKAKLF